MKGKRRAADQISLLALGCVLAAGPVWADSLSAKEAYLKYRAALAESKKIEDLQSLISKKRNEEIDHTPADDKPMMFGLIKLMTPTNIQVLSETVNGDTATLTLSGRTEPADAKVKEETSGKVTLVKEDGTWKIDKEAWNSKTEYSGDAPTQSK